MQRRTKAHLAATLYRLKDPAARGHKRYCLNSGSVYWNIPGQRKKLRTAKNEHTAVMLVPVQIKVTSANSPTGSPAKYNLTPKKGNADNLFSVWPGEDFKVTIQLPSGFTPYSGMIKWNLPTGIADNTLEHTFNWTSTGTNIIEIQIGSTKYKISVDVPDVGSVSQDGAIATLAPWVTAEIGSWANYSLTYCNAHYPNTPLRDAIRHSYWNALCVSDGYVTQTQTLYFTTSHEYDNKNIDTPRQPAFDSTMDLWNNFTGSTVQISYLTIPPTPNQTAILQALEQKYSAGQLRIWDGGGSEDISEGIILNSNGTKILPTN